jgi:single-stranded-DNA-specific exonuclease
VTRFHWRLPDSDVRRIEALAAALGIESPAAQVLVHRGYGEPAAARRFLSASLEDLHDPMAMMDMDRAAARLVRAVRDNEPILIYGDYDVDGTSSIVLLVKAIELAGGRATYHVPDRLRDGYGMRPEVVEKAAADGVRLIISVDTGIRAAEVVAHATRLGVDVIITDHHLPESELPPALAVLNPNRPGCGYPHQDLCGAGVAFKLAQALFTGLGWPEEKRKRLAGSFLKLVAIATVADVVPLTGENRVIVRHGLDGFRQLRNPGLRALVEVSGLPAGSAPSARQVAFQLAPRMNAAGRMDTARAVVEMLLTGDTVRARDLARQLHEQNGERQQVEAAILDACLEQPCATEAAALVYYSEGWHRGVLGIVASRLVERRNRPVFVLGLNPDDGLAQGSGRSIPAFHLLDALESMSDLFVRFGGHKYAAGVTLRAERVEEFRARFHARAAEQLKPEDFLPVLEIDAVVQPGDLDDRSTAQVLALAPFGHGNPPPSFCALGVEVAASPVVWSERHLRVTVRQNDRLLALKAWNFAGRVAEMAAGARLDIAFTLEDDAYSAARGYPGWCAVLRDVRPAAQAREAGA